MNRFCGLFRFCAVIVTLGACSAAGASLENGFYGDYATALKEFIDNKGMVNYKLLKAKPAKLQAFIAAIGSLDESTYEQWNDHAKIAFWLNAYNAITLKAIIDNYPIKSSFFKSLKFPKNSIRQIDGVWDKIKFNVMGKKFTLEDIEHKILRKRFDEPRIHTAMVCAAMGCPPLRNEPYQAEKLVLQLEDQSRRFLLDPKKFKIDHEKGIVFISLIFKWIGDDFIKSYAPNKSYRGHEGSEAAVIKFIIEHLPEKLKKQWLVNSRMYKISYLDYDWSLNEQNEKGNKKLQ